MVEWKARVTIRIPPSLRGELIRFACGEQRSLGNLGPLLIEWGFQQLKAVGSTDNLLRQIGRRTARG
jgi:hypothetical protein